MSLSEYELPPAFSRSDSFRHSKCPSKQFGCQCNLISGVECFPLLRAVLDRCAGSFLGYVFALVCRVLVSASAVLPESSCSRLVLLMQCLDCFAFIFVCCVEIVFPNLNRVSWGGVREMPLACYADSAVVDDAPRTQFSSGEYFMHIS